MQLKYYISILAMVCCLQTNASNYKSIQVVNSKDSIHLNSLKYRNDSLFNAFKGEINFLKVVQSNDIDFSSFRPLIKNDRLFLISGLGGAVYKEDEIGMVRIDNSFEHKNQLASSLFVHNDTIFRFGGYGFFDTRNFFTYFSEQTNEWEVYKTNSVEFPDSRMDNKFFTFQDSFFLIGGRSINPNDRNQTVPKNDVWQFSFVDKSWNYIGELEAAYDLTYSMTDFGYDDKFVFKTAGSWYSLDLSSNGFSTINDTDFLKKVRPGSVVTQYRDSLYFVLSTPNSELQRSYVYPIAKYDFSELETNLVLSENGWPYYLLGVPILVVLVFFYLKKYRESKEGEFKLTSSVLSFNNFRVNLLPVERECIALFLKDPVVNNYQLLDLIEGDLDISQKTRIKNTLIRDLNNKLDIISGGRYQITKTPSKSDRRFFEYRLGKI